MTIKQLIYFITVYEKGSATKASDELYISQQAISLAITELEKEFGQTLFVRTGNQIKPTIYAKYLYERSTKTVSDFNAIKIDFNEKFRSKKTLKIATAPGVLRSIPITSIVDFQEKNQHIETIMNHYVDDICEEKINNGEVDIALSINSPSVVGLDKTVIQTEPYYIITNKNHRLKNQEIVKFSDLKNEKLVTFDEHYRIHGNIKRICRHAGFEANIVFTSTEGATLAKYAIASSSIFVCVKHITEELRFDNMLAIPIDTKFSWEIVSLTKPTVFDNTNNTNNSDENDSKNNTENDSKNNTENNIKKEFIDFLLKSINHQKV